jgi:hypothetical protein
MILAWMEREEKKKMKLRGAVERLKGNAEKVTLR